MSDKLLQSPHGQNENLTQEEVNEHEQCELKNWRKKKYLKRR